MLKPISISLSPNTEKDDVWLALSLILRKIPAEERLKRKSLLQEALKNYLGAKHVFLFNSGRTSLMAILHALELERGGSEVLLQAFTCNAAVNPIIWSGLKPVYVDCDEETFNIDLGDLKRKITSKSRAVVIQHTFGLPADIDGVIQICRQQNLILIEDCAHALGAEYKERKVGTIGDVSFFSFSRDKVISSVYGGAVATNNDILAEKISKYHENLEYPSWLWIYQQLLHPVLMSWLILPTYRIFGKYLLILFQWLHLLSKAIQRKEKSGAKPGYFPQRLPASLAVLAQSQLKKIERFNAHRKEIARFYRQELKKSAFELPVDVEQIYLRFTIKHPRSHEIIKKARRKNILIGDWYDSVIAPADTKLDKMGYIKGSCPKAEKLAEQTLNLPTHINISLEKDAEKIIKFLEPWK